MWRALRDRQLGGMKFRRQRPIAGFIVDFACIEHRLIVEIDGGQHADNATDETRSEKLRAAGWTVIRFWNNEVLASTQGVLETIARDGATTPAA